MSQKTRDAFIISLISLAIISLILILANFSAESTGRLVALMCAMGIVGFAHVVAAYNLRKEEIQAEKEIELASLGVLKKRPDDRTILYNSPTSKVSTRGMIRLTEHLELPKQDLVDFIAGSMEKGGPGLSITQWKSRGWDQTKVENLLDFMYELELITPRENGRACHYLRVTTPNEVLRIISLNSL